MGLDMYAYSVGKHPENTDLYIATEDRIKFYYWRKLNALHDWMEQAYNQKGGEEEFNCQVVRLSEADIDRLEQQIDDLKPVTGFFFGPQEYNEEDKEEVRKFIKKAREALAAGREVYYDSWW